MPRLLVTRGLPASGKTTYAHAWVAEDREHRTRVNRDDLRGMLDEGLFEKGVSEPRILIARDALILGFLGRSLDVIADDTALPQRVARDLARLAKRAAAEFEVIDFTHVPLEECLTRDAARTDKPPVGETVIRDMHTRYLKGRVLPLPLPAEDEIDLGPDLYIPVPGTPKAVVVDVDGTVALMAGRSPFDETRVHEDQPNAPVIAVVQALAAAGYVILFVSGRTEGCREETQKWLAEHVRVPFRLFMRPAGDKRKDYLVKLDLFNTFIRFVYDVLAWLDDRSQVVHMEREVLGLTVLQVAEGNY